MICILPCSSHTLQTHTPLLCNENRLQGVPCLSVQQGAEYEWYRFKKDAPFHTFVKIYKKPLFTTVAALHQEWNQALTRFTDRFHSSVKGMRVNQILCEEPVYQHQCTAGGGTISSITKKKCLVSSRHDISHGYYTCFTASGKPPGFRVKGETTRPS